MVKSMFTKGVGESIKDGDDDHKDGTSFFPDSLNRFQKSFAYFFQIQSITSESNHQYADATPERYQFSQHDVRYNDQPDRC